jgi:uncharacterized protein (TIGR02118 family)
MYAVVGLLNKAEGQTPEQFKTWWLESHVPHVLQMPGLLDYRLWVIEETLDQKSLQFSDEKAFDGVAVITFESKAAFEASLGSPEGRADNDSFNQGAPRSTVLAGTPYVFRQATVAGV